MRSSLDASRMPPHSTHPHASPSFRYSSTEYIIIRVRFTDERSWPTSPAEWKVDPDVSWFRSRTTTSSQPSSARWYAIDVPPDSAADDHAPRGAGELPERGHYAAGRLDPALEARVLPRLLQAVEVLLRVLAEVEVELGHAPLHDAPHRLAEVGHEAEQLQRRAVSRSSGGSPK